MIAPPVQNIAVIRAGTADAERVASCCSSNAFRQAARVIKSDRRTSVISGSMPASATGHPTGGQAIIVKSMRLNRLKDRLAMLFGRTRLQRQWFGAVLLEEAGIPVAMPMVIWRGRADDGSLVESLAMPHVEGRTLLHQMACRELDRSDEAAIIQQLGWRLRRMREHRAHPIFDRDHKPSNTIVELTEFGPRLVAIDTTGVRPGRPTDREERMLASLIIEPIGVGCPPRRAACMRLLRAAYPGMESAQRHQVWRSVAALIARHGDPTPKINPLDPAPVAAATHHHR